MEMRSIQNILYLFLGLLGNLSHADTELFKCWQSQEARLMSHIWPQKTIQCLESALDKQHNPVNQITIRIELSELYRVTNEAEKAKENAEQAITMACDYQNQDKQFALDKALLVCNRTSNQYPLLSAKALNVYGNILMNSEYYLNYEGAFKNYQTALKLFSIEQQPQLYANILTNMAQLWIDVSQYSDDHEQKQALYQNDNRIVLEKAIQALDMALTATRNLPNDDKKAANLIHLSKIARHIQTELAPQQIQLTLKAYQALKEVRHFDATKFPRVVSYAYGYLGELYQAKHRYSEALQLTRQAIFYAQTAQATDILYLWERQLGQLLVVQGNQEAAINAYQQAVKYLAEIRPRLAKASYRSRQMPFRETVVGKIYLELTDLLLQKAKDNRNNTLYPSCLHQAQEVIEQFKQVELENYFKDDCVGRKKEGTSKSQFQKCATFQRESLLIPNDTAVLYPIIFPERLELLLYTSHKWKLVTVAVKKKELAEQIEVLIIELNSDEPDEMDDLLLSAQYLYNWLIRPIESDIAQVKTLIVIPDGLVRTIPFAVLHDKKRYLIETHALATTPSLGLTELKPWERRNPKQGTTFLLNGLSEDVKIKDEIYEALNFVELEIKAISQLYPSNILLNETFTEDTFSTKLKEVPYQVVHIATHGKFNKTAKESFLLTHHGLLKMENLETIAHWGTFRSLPVELLTLSACESAMEDDKAALGLSGIAVKAGAKSALASLWQVDDGTTCYLMEAFYRHLKEQPTISKAKALQKAKIQLLTGAINQNQSRCDKLPGDINDYKHPYYWAAFLLIGNWL